jgi:two-component system chemotaxis sensor kinase CheA
MTMDEIEIDREALIRSFVAEAAEALSGMEQTLVALEARPGDEELVHELFRAAHTLKGSAGLVGFDGVQDVAHQLEDLLARVRSKEVAITDALVTLLLRSVDVLRAAVADAEAGRTELSADAGAFRDLVRRAAGGAQVALEAAAEAQDAPEATLARPARGRTLRVDVGKLDRMLDLCGEIGISRGRLGDMLEHPGAFSPESVLEGHRETDRLYLDLQELVLKARMVPLGPTFHQHRRTVRDVAATQGKQVRLVIEGEDVEVDTSIVEGIRDPLTHMVRNAIDHGIEAPTVRRERGKDPTGVLALRAYHEGSSIVVQVADDGGGIDATRLRRRAEELGFVTPGAALGEGAVRRLVFEPGLSTSEEVTEISGRGVGMDVVRRNVEALRGSVDVDSAPGRGTTITMRLPLTLAIIQGFRVSVGDEVYVLPLDAVAECLEMPHDGRGQPVAEGVLDLRGRPLPYLRLRDLFRVGGQAPAQENVVVIEQGTTLVGLVVDALLGESQTVIKPLGRVLRHAQGVSGSAILGDGRVALILDAPGLLREALRRAPQAAATPALADAAR